MTQRSSRHALLPLFVALLVAVFAGCTADSSPAPGVAARPVAGLELAGEAPRAGEELWVVARPQQQELERGTGSDSTAHLQAGADLGEDLPADIPGTGGLIARDPASGTHVVVPLTHTEVRARIDGDAASVAVEQRFENPWSVKIEASYVFPLPTDAAVHEFVMTIGERRIRGIVRERQEAERIYQEARAAGHVAALLTQERPNVFTQKVANIEPGKTIDVAITYLTAVPWRDGAYEFDFPMVVGPRFNPPHTLAAGKGLVAVQRGSTGGGGMNTTVPYLAPNERSGHDIALTVAIDAGVEIAGVECSTHRIDVERTHPSRATVRLSPLDTIANKDFVLRWSVAGDGSRAGFLAHARGDEGAFALTVHPPAELNRLPREALEVIFVVDCSGSMAGAPLGLARDAIHEGLRRLEATDTFQIIRFANDDERMSAGALAVNARNLRDGRRYVDGLEANGGTMMIRGVQAALRHPGDDSRRRVIAFLTDGYIGNEEEILGEVRNHIGRARIFSFGIGSSPNRFLLERMAREGNGAVAYVQQGSNAAEVMAAFLERVSHPALTDLRVEWNGIAVRDALPTRLPDLFVGRPLNIRGRFDPRASAEPGALRVVGRAGGREIALDIPLAAGALSVERPGLLRLWAREQITDWLSLARGADSEIDVPRLVRELALEHGLLSAWTAFVAVDSATVTAGDHGITVPVALELPEGVRYETTVSSGASEGSSEGNVERD